MGNRRTANRNPGQRAGHFSAGERQSEVLAGARAHKAHGLLQLGLLRIDHHGREVIVAEALHHIEGVLRIAVQADDDGVVMLFHHLWQIVQVGREGRILPHCCALESRQRVRYFPAMLIIRINERDRQLERA